MFKTAITRSAVDRVQVQCNSLRQSQTRAKTAGNAISGKSKQILSKPAVLILIFTFGAYLGIKGSATRDQKSDLEKADNMVVIKEGTKKTSYLLSFVGTAISAVSLYLRIMRTNRSAIETTDVNQ